MDRRTFLKKASMTALVVASAGFRCRPKNTLARRTLLVAGSSTILPYIKALMAGFAKEQPHVDLVAEGGGTSAGMLAVARGAIDLGLMSRDLSAHEDDELEVRTILIAKDAMAIVVHPSNPISDLTSAVVRDIFQGRIKQWKELPGGASAPITVVSRRLGSPGRRGFEDLALGGDEVFHKASQYGTPEDARKAVASNLGAVGFLAMNDLQPAVKTLKIDGVAPDRRSILSDRFKYSRPFFLAVKGAPQGATKDFLDYCTSGKGQQVLSDHGLLPVY